MNSKECHSCHQNSPANAASCRVCGREFIERSIRKDCQEWVINPKWLELVEADLAQARRDRDEWLWCYSVMVSVLRGTSGWETAKEVGDFGSGLVDIEGVKLAKVAREAVEFHEQWKLDSSLEKWFPFSAAELELASMQPIIIHVLIASKLYVVRLDWFLATVLSGEVKLNEVSKP